MLIMKDDELRTSVGPAHLTRSDVAHMSRAASVGEIAAFLAHELKQPLAAILSNCDASLRWQFSRPANVEEMGHAVTRIRRDALRALAILERIREFLRNPEPKHVPVNLGEAAQEVLDMLAPELQRHAIELVTHVPPDLPKVCGTRVELQQVLLNLCTNAIESLAQLAQDMPRKLKVEVRRRRGNCTDEVFIVVQDSGPGFKQSERRRLFDAFYTTKSTGLGVGLAISRSIVRRHGGELRARNTPRGPRFEFFIPVPQLATT